MPAKREVIELEGRYTIRERRQGRAVYQWPNVCRQILPRRIGAQRPRRLCRKAGWSGDQKKR